MTRAVLETRLALVREALTRKKALSVEVTAQINALIGREHELRELLALPEEEA